jgi:hypothetical protein
VQNPLSRLPGSLSNRIPFAPCQVLVWDSRTFKMVARLQAADAVISSLQATKKRLFVASFNVLKASRTVLVPTRHATSLPLRFPRFPPNGLGLILDVRSFASKPWRRWPWPGTLTATGSV